MSEIPFYWVDAFTDRPFGGNPAAVCPLEDWLPDEELQRLAWQHGLSETAFTVPIGSGRYKLRWFTPNTEVDLCGHATLAPAHIILNEGQEGSRVEFESQSGPLFVVLSSEDAVASLQPDFESMVKYSKSSVIVTAPGIDRDFVSRNFAPGYGINEDPVTGSAHCTLTPYWENRLGKSSLHAHNRFLNAAANSGANFAAIASPSRGIQLPTSAARLQSDANSAQTVLQHPANEAGDSPNSELMILARCFSTVRVLKSRSDATSLEERPAATKQATSSSRAERAEGGTSLAGGRLPPTDVLSACT